MINSLPSFLLDKVLAWFSVLRPVFSFRAVCLFFRGILSIAPLSLWEVRRVRVMPYSICLTVRSASRPVRPMVVCRIRGENRTMFSKNFSRCQAELGPALKLTARCVLLAIRENYSCDLYYSCSSLKRDNVYPSL